MNAEVIDILRSIDATLKRMEARRKPTSTAPSAVDLDGKYGDPTVRQKDPRDWHGEPMKGRHFSECPAEYLDLLAERFDYFASKEEDAKKQTYNLLDAQRARGWAARIRSGATPTRQPQIQSKEEW